MFWQTLNIINTSNADYCMIKTDCSSLNRFEDVTKWLGHYENGDWIATRAPPPPQLCAMLSCEIAAILLSVSGSGSMVRVPGLTSVFIYPQLSISISTVPAHFQASSRGTPEQSFFFTFTSYFWFQHRSCFVISNMEKCESKKKYCAGSAALHAAQLRDDWEESWLSMINLHRF